jgi:hypothetical protein
MTREERIAARLIAAISPLMPASCTTSIRAGWLEVAVDGHWWVSIGLAVYEGGADREAVLAFNVLSTLQDVIVRAATRPWPPAGEPTDVPYPAAAVRHGLLVAWFGPEEKPALTPPPIELASV